MDFFREIFSDVNRSVWDATCCTEREKLESGPLVGRTCVLVYLSLSSTMQVTRWDESTKFEAGTSPIHRTADDTVARIPRSPLLHSRTPETECSLKHPATYQLLGTHIVYPVKCTGCRLCRFNNMNRFFRRLSIVRIRSIVTSLSQSSTFSIYVPRVAVTPLLLATFSYFRRVQEDVRRPA